MSVLLGLLLLCAGDPVESVIEAHRSGKDLRELAERDDPDPWILADELCARGEYDAADAFSKAAPRPDTERLGEYVAAQRLRPTDRKIRRAVAAAYRALEARRLQEVLAHAAVEASEDVSGIRLLRARAVANQGLWRAERCADAYLECGRAADRLGWLSLAVHALQEGGEAAYSRSAWAAALAAWKRCSEIENARGRRGEAAALLGNIGNCHLEMGNYPQALEHYEQALAGNREAENELGAATALGNLGLVYERTGNYDRALALLTEALEMHESAGNRAAVAWTLANLGDVRDSMGEYERALDCLRRALERSEALGDGAGVAGALGRMGVVEEHRGNYEVSLDLHGRALKLWEGFGDRAGVALTLGNLGVVHQRLGRHAQALAMYDRALREHEDLMDRAGVARTLGNIGSVHERLGDPEAALGYFARALAIAEEIENRAGAASLLGSIGMAHHALGDAEKSLSFLHRSLDLSLEIGDRAGAAYALGALGDVRYALGDYPQALEFHRRALDKQEALGDRAGAVGSLGSIAFVQSRLGNDAEALAFHERAREGAVQLGALEPEIQNLWGLAGAYLRLGDCRRAMENAREAVLRLPRLVGRLSEELGASARSRWSGLFDTGVRAALRAGDPRECSFFLESGRAGTLLEGLAAREDLIGALVPAELRQAEQASRQAEKDALARYRASLTGGADTEARWNDYLRAQEATADAVRRIQREVQAQASLLYPEADALEDVQTALRPGEALVTYGLPDDRVVALVVTRGDARIVDLGPLDPLRPSIEALQRAAGRPDERGIAAPPHQRIGHVAAQLSRGLIAPLGLDEEIERVLVSPDGVLAYLPFAALLGSREVVYLSSGTAYRRLRRERDRRPGVGVLALGDPAGGAAADGSDAGPRSGSGSLPASGAEARSVGDHVLLGEQATLRGLRDALALRARWRSVHIACHGQIDAERPALSSLVLAPTAEDDGLLRCRDIYRWKIPADLAVLSACETARGRVYRGEGVIGFVRAFMHAGAPRVIVSIWKVDDEATRALMTAFYENWRTMPAATALKRAQASVAEEEKWSHPYFWAAWQLWGLPD